MKTYANINKDSGIAAYDYDDDWIRIRFKDGGTYEYHEYKIGYVHLATMKRLADSGHGLNSYINKNQDVKHGWHSKF